MSGVLHDVSQQRFIGEAGGVVGALMFFYYTTTTDLAPIYSDSGLTTPLANPVAVAAGEILPDIYLDSEIAYRRRIVYNDGTEDDVDPLPIPVSSSSLAGPTGADQIGFLQEGPDAVLRTLASKEQDIVSVLDFASEELRQKITSKTATIADATETTEAIQAALNRDGSAVTAGTAVSVYLPDGLYWVNYVGTQGSLLKGESRLGTVVKSASNGTQAVFDSRINRDGTTANTAGNCVVENLSIDLNNTNRVGVCFYGGSCIGYNLEVYGGSSVGLLLQYVLKTTLLNVTVRDNDADAIIINVDEPLHTGDVNTSIKMINVWCLSNGGWGILGQNMNYCAFDNVTTQANGSGGTSLNGSLGGLTSMNCLVFNNCASEQDNGPAWKFVKLRNFIILSPFVLADADSNTIDLDDSLGEIRGFTDTTSHTGGTYSIRVTNAPVLGGVIVASGNFTIDPTQLKFCSFNACIVNTAVRSSLNQLWFNNAADAQAFRLETTALGGDYSGLGVFDNDGKRIAAFRRFSGGMIISSGGAADPAALNNGDFIIDVGTTTLTFQAKGTDGTVRTGTVTLS